MERHWHRARSLAVLVAAILSCEPGSATGRRMAFDPPLSYREYWREISECAGKTGDFDRLTWMEAPDGSLGKGVLGRWDWPHTITLTSWVAAVEVKTTIQHEMLHDLNQSGEHGPEFERCGV